MHQVGAGVLGPVFRGYDPELDRAVAIKALSLDLTPEQARDLAADLGRLPTLALGHPSIIAPLGAGADGSTAYLVEEYFVAESADVALKQYGPAPAPDALRLIGQLAGALDFAAGSGVHHGALHPRDILVAPHEVRLTGLGVVAALERVGFRPQIRRPYAAPERVSGGPVTGAADVFSLACVAFELVTGRRPTLSADTVTVDTKAIQAADAVALAEVFARALSARPDDRYPSALAFAAALKHALTGEPLQAGADTEHPRPRRAGKGGRKTPPLPLEPERDAPVAEEPRAALPEDRPLLEDLPLAEPLGSEVYHDVTVALQQLEARDANAPLEPAVELPAAPAPGSTPLPSFLEAYQEVAPLVPEPEPDLSEFDRRIEPRMATPIILPRTTGESPEHSDAEPLTQPLEDLDVAGHDSEAPPVLSSAAPGMPREERTMFGSLAPLPEPAGPNRGTRLVPLLGMLFVGILLGLFAAGYLLGSRGRSSTLAAPGPGTSREQPQPAPTPASARLPAPAPPVAQAVEAPRQSANATRAATGGTEAAAAAPTDKSAKMTPRQRRPARAQTQRDAARAAVGTAGAKTAAPGRKANPARTGTAFVGSLVIVSKPEGASVTLDGHPVGTTPLTLPTVKAGSHAIRLERAGHRVWSSAVQVSAGRQKRITASLERRPGG